MSTRSGKRIHKSFQEDVLNGAADVGSKTERKTRSRRLKGNCDALNITMSTNQKRKNYVHHPIIDETNHDAGDAGSSDSCTVQTEQRNTLKELNVEVSVDQSALDSEKNFALRDKHVRQTRRTKRFIDNNEKDIAGGDVTAADANIYETKIPKKIKKKKSLHNEVIIANNLKENEEVRQVPQNKSKRKMKGKKRSGSMIIEDIVPPGAEKQRSLHSNNTSVDSFHSAAGSSDYKDNYVNSNGHVQDVTDTLNKSPVDRTIPMSNKDKSKSPLDKLAETQSPGTSKSLNSSVVTSIRKRSSTADNKDTTFNKTIEPEKLANVSKKLDSTFDKDVNSNSTSKKFNTTFERDSRTRKSLCVSNATEEISNRNSKSLNGTFDKLDTSKTQSSVKSPNTTFDKPIGSNKTPDFKKHNSTFDKSENNSATKTESVKKSSNISSDKSENYSIISSDVTDGTDGTTNSTFDKSDENLPRISITSDESKTENLLNTTPVLIESSMETSDLSGTSSSLQPTGKPTDAVTTPLKREGTFTKDGPDPIIIMSPLPKTYDDGVKTPTKRTISLPSPGCTPYHSNTKPSQKKGILNKTRSIEKLTFRRSLLVEPVRTTKVMFCSPVDNPALNTQRKNKVIKSSMKGSNKSFLFEEEARGLPPRPAPRKRSYTASDADEIRAKRTRLTDELQNSVNRLSRPRTSSAAGTPLPKPATPARSRSESKRVKLPNFAALHQKQFSRMESLDECQQRRARRARQLLVPTGGLQVLERASPKCEYTEHQKQFSRMESLDECQLRRARRARQLLVPTGGLQVLERASPKLTPPEQPKSAKEKETKTQQTPSKTKPKNPPKAKPAAEPPMPGYTRFGFKLNLDVNPFSIPSKTLNQKPTENKPNGLLKRQLPQPSTAGVTGVRKEVAKQVIMREKSATSLREKRDAKRIKTRTIIKGVRTNRRFELQMQSRNIDG